MKTSRQRVVSSTRKTLSKKTAPTDAPIPAALEHAIQTEEASQPREPRGKLGEVVRLLRRPEGAPIQDMMTATGWQAHSVRGAMSGAIKKKLKLNVVSEKPGDTRSYRIVGEPA